MKSSDYRYEARKALKGRWGEVVIIVFIYTLILFICSGCDLTQYKDVSGINLNLAKVEENSSNNLINFNFSGGLPLLVSAFVMLGYTSIFIKVAQNENIKLTDLFSKIKYVFKVIGMTLLLIFYVCCWLLLFIIPGIMKIYAYSMSYKILAQNPEYGINECITRSKEMMEGNKMDLFLLQLSFIGWSLLVQVGAYVIAIVLSKIGLNILTESQMILAIQGLILGPILKVYSEIAETIFYLDITNQTYNDKKYDDETIDPSKYTSRYNC